MIYHSFSKDILRTFILALVTLIISATSQAESSINLQIQIPALDTSPYHRPYIAVWLESPKRQGITTLAIWYDDDEWLKDLRQWWRKLGRKDRSAYDSVTGATRKPGLYTFSWDGLNAQGDPIPEGEYILNIEASREAGGRDFLRQKIHWRKGLSPQTYSLPGKVELGTVTVSIQ